MSHTDMEKTARTQQLDYPELGTHVPTGQPVLGNN